MKKQPFHIVAFGDSLTYGYGIPYECAYPRRLQERLEQYISQFSCIVSNSGINGHTTREGLIRLYGSVLQKNPQIVLILFGSNDSALHDEQYRTLYEYEKNLREMIDQILHLQTEHAFRNGTPLPILITPPSMIEDDCYPFTTNERLQKYGQIVKKIAEEYTLPCIDLFAVYQAIKDTDTYERCFQQDGLHLSLYGYDIFFEQIWSVLKEILDTYTDNEKKPLCQ